VGQRIGLAPDSSIAYSCYLSQKWTCFLLTWQGAAACVCEIIAQKVKVSLTGFYVVDAVCWYLRDSDVWKLKVSVICQLILCLSYLLAALERSSWNNEYTLHVFRSLLPFIASPKAKACHSHIVLNYFRICTDLLVLRLQWNLCLDGMLY